MGELGSIFSENIAAAFFLILGTIALIYCIGYLFRLSRRIKHGRRFTDRKVNPQKSDDSAAEQKKSD
jgi:hypothetical protein